MELVISIKIFYFFNKRKEFKPTRTVPPSCNKTATHKGTSPSNAGDVAKRMTLRARHRFCLMICNVL